MISQLVLDFQSSVWSVPSISVAILGLLCTGVCNNVRNPVCSQGNWSFSFLSSMNVPMNECRKKILPGRLFRKPFKFFIFMLIELHSYFCQLICIQYTYYIFYYDFRKKSFLPEHLIPKISFSKTKSGKNRF